MRVPGRCRGHSFAGDNLDHSASFIARPAGYRDGCHHSRQSRDRRSGRTCGRQWGRAAVETRRAGGARPGRDTGRSAKDKFIVRDAETEDTVWWGRVNASMTPEHFANLKADFMAALGERETLYVADLFGGSQPEHRVNVRVINELAWHNLFIRTLLVRPTTEELADFAPEYTIIDLPSFQADRGTAWREQRNDRGGQSDRKADPDRRNPLCRRNEEKRVRHSQLPVAAGRRDADALQRQYRRGRQDGGVLRPVGNRQDHA